MYWDLYTVHKHKWGNRYWLKQLKLHSKNKNKYTTTVVALTSILKYLYVLLFKVLKYFK